jgi:molybdopterin converting factor small subunit
MPVFRIPTPLRAYTNGLSEIPVAGQTVSDALADLTTRHPGLKPHLVQENGQLRAFVNLFRGEDNVSSLQGLATPLAENDRLLIIPSIAGG